MLLAPCKVIGDRRDGIPNVVVEAMAMGVPCAGTQAAGLEEIIAAGETGTLTAPGDPDAMVEALVPRCANQRRSTRWGLARARVVRDFDAAANFERLAALFDDRRRGGAALRRDRGHGTIGGVMSTPREAEPMRVPHVIEAMHQGGAESLLIEHARHAAPGVEVLIAALNRGGPALEQADAAGARTFVLGGRGAPVARVRSLATLIRRERVSPSTGTTRAAPSMRRSRRGSRVPAFRTEHSLHYGGRHSSTYAVLEPLLSVLTRRVVCGVRRCCRVTLVARSGRHGASRRGERHLTCTAHPPA
jgi:hypothetical protein